MKEQKPKFSRIADSDFHATLKKRVNEYFKTNNLSKHGNFGLVIKTVLVIAMYLVPYFITMLGIVTAPWLIILLWTVMGVGLAGIGMNVMHDANHGSYSKNGTINKMLGLSLNFMGGDAALWRLQHNVLHHTYTNIEGVDDDLNSAAILRFSPHQKKLKIHQYQHIYAWFLYGLMSFSWMTWGDIGQAVRFYKRGFYADKKTYQKEMAKIVAWKVGFYIVTIVLPIIFLPGPFWVFLVASIATHFTVSWILSTVFQTAHVMPDSKFPLPDNEGKMDNTWAVHQFLTTNNYAPKNPILTWMVGGLNYQIEHHLFPNVSHVHYRKISSIVKETAKEYGVPYYSQKSFFHALWHHGRFLRSLGRMEPVRLSNELPAQSV